MIFDDVFINNLPTLDLHGEIKDSARVLIKEFIYDNYVMKNKKVVIIHGIGKGKIKEEVINNLKNNKMVLSFHLNRYNSGCIVVYIKDKK